MAASGSHPVRVDPVFGCHFWTGRFDRDGYPRTDAGQLAHRAVYEATVGPIPAGLELDHWCRRRACVLHIEPVTRSENEKRKHLAYRLKLKRCPRGHQLNRFTRAMTPEGGIVCRTCRDGHQ